MRLWQRPKLLVGRYGINLHFPRLRIECEAGVKQHRDAFKFPSSLFRLGRQTAGETLCLTPHLLMQLECQQALHSYFQYPSPIYGGRERKVHNVGNFPRHVVWTNRTQRRKRLSSSLHSNSHPFTVIHVTFKTVFRFLCDLQKPQRRKRFHIEIGGLPLQQLGHDQRGHGRKHDPVAIVSGRCVVSRQRSCSEDGKSVRRAWT